MSHAPKFCQECSAALEPGVRFCGECGQPVAAAPPQQLSSQAIDVQRVTYTRRFFGDLLLEGVLVALTLVVGWFIWLFFTAKTAQTPAKRLLNVYIVDAYVDEPVSAGRVWAREFLVKGILFGIVGEITFGIAQLVDYAWVLIDGDRQALHDKIVSTRVVYAPHGLHKRRAAAEPIP
jgi:uncharacterized RDD family membrane protein YckC